MSFWDDVSWQISMVMEPLGAKVFNGLNSAVDATDKVVSTGIEVVGGGLDSMVQSIKENPAEAALIAAAAVATGGAAFAAAGPLASVLGSTGLLGAASTGTAISTLTGAALESASLAAIGGGALSASGAGMVGGTVAIATTGAAAGSAASAIALKSSSS